MYNIYTTTLTRVTQCRVARSIGLLASLAVYDTHISACEITHIQKHDWMPLMLSSKLNGGENKSEAKLMSQDQPPGVLAAPNRVRFDAVVQDVQQSPKYPDKWLFNLIILDSESISGPNFAHKNEQVTAYIISDTRQVSTGQKISAQAEYIGDGRAGTFQMFDIQVIE